MQFGFPGGAIKCIKILVGLLFLAMAGGTHAQQPIVIKFSHVVAPDAPKGKAALKFKELVEERSKGRVKVEVYPNSQLYKDREEIEALQLGAVQMLAPSLGKFGPLGVREFDLFELPYIFPNMETLHQVTEGEIGRKLFQKLEQKGIIGLAYWDNGFRQMSANRPLKNVDDFKGLKMRIQSSKVLEAQMVALGANPQVMAFSEVYTALQQGVVDGTENVMSNFYTQRMNEAQKYLTISDHNYLGYAVIVNKKFWDGLPEDIRTLLEGAVKDATKYNNELVQKENNDALAQVRAAKTTEIYVLPDAERLKWQQKLLPVHQQFEAIIGKDLIYGVYQIAANVAKAKQK